MTRAFLSRLALVAFLLFSSSGCVESPASWLPDSSGFLFVHDDAGTQTVHHYDLAKKGHKMVATLDAPVVSDLAVHPKGDAFALVMRKEKGAPVLSFFDLAGKSLHRSDPLDLKTAGPITLHWFPQGDRLWLGMEDDHGLYDSKKRELTLKPGGTPWPAMLGSSIRPDGRGYVVRRKDTGYLYLDLEGWERRLKEDVDLWVKGKEVVRAPRFRWDERRLHVGLHGSTVLDVDTEKGVAVRNDFDPKMTRAFEPNPAKDPTPLDVVLFAGDETALVLLQDEGKTASFQVIAHRFGENKSKTLVANCDRAFLLPAPDHRHALIFHEKADGKRALLLVDEKADVIDEIALGKARQRGSSSLARIIRGQAPDDEAPPPAKPQPAYYEVALDTLLVRPTKAGGRGWDSFGGHPDLEVQIRNLRSGSSFASAVADDTVEHAYNVLAGKVALGDVLEIDVWDKDVCYHDHVGLKRLELTRDVLEKGAIELSFGQVSSLQMRFFPLRSTSRLKVDPKPGERAFEDGRVATLFEQLAPSTVGMDQAVRTADRERAIVLIHGLRAQLFDGSRAYRPYFDSWQEPHGMLVSTLVELGDVYGFSYGQNRELEYVSGHPELREGIRRLTSMGYKEIILVGHSAGGVIARQFVEDHPYEGVTHVVQVCSPNAGAGLAHCWFAAGPKQTPFLQSLIPQTRSVESARRDACIPSHIAFTCLVGTYGKCGDGALSCHSQWPTDLQEQGIPAYPVRVNHHSSMESHRMVRKIADVIATPQERWTGEEVENTRRVFFD